MEKNYWGYRIDKNRIGFFMDELNNGRLRQGWGWHESQNLRDFKMDGGAKRNMPMFHKVKKGDILFVPRLPSWGEVAIVEATEDWNVGYQFEIYQEYGDYGHIFPARFIKRFTRNNEHVTGNIRSTLRNPSRFWNINRYVEDIEKLLSQDSLLKEQDHHSRLTSTVGEVFNNVFDDQEFTKQIYDKLNEQFTGVEWESALVDGLQELCPFYQIERVGGKKEKNHGTDILIKLPSPLEGYQYAIAIQVKDYEGKVSESVINQINKADDYWQNEEGLKLIDKWLIITKAPKDSNNEIENNESGVKVIFANELKALLSRIAKNMITME